MSRRRHSLGVAIPRTVTPEDMVLADALEKIRALEPEWQLAGQVARAIEQVGDRVIALEDDRLARDGTINGVRRWLWTSAGGALVALATAVWAAIGAAGAAGEKRGAAAAREAQQREDRAAIRELQEQAADLGREVSQLRGEIRGLYPLRSVPVLGPRNVTDQDQE